MTEIGPQGNPTLLYLQLAMFASWTYFKFQGNKESCEFDQIIAKHVQHAVQKKWVKNRRVYFFTLKNSGCQELGSSNKFLQE